MAKYNREFKDQVITVVKMLIDQGTLDKRVGDLAKNPINISGVRAVALELEASARKSGSPKQP